MKTIKEELLRWICEQRATNSFLDRHLLREKALELTKMRRLNGFKCSNQWITVFLKQHGFSTDLTYRTGPIFDNYRDWIDLMRSTIIKYRHNELFHADELVMYSDILPTRIAAERIGVEGETCLPRNRITILMSCNSSGTTKLPLLICGPYPSEITTKDHVYRPSDDSRIDDDLFENWLLTINDRMSRCDRQILLFLRQERAHALRNVSLSNVKLVYLPESFPPLLRPLRRDVFHYVKMIFRRRYAERLIRRIAEWNVRDILESVIDAWQTIPREIIICSFQRTRFRTDDYFLQIDCNHWENLKTGIAFKKFVTFDDDLSDTRESSVGSNRYHGYNLRASCRELVRVNECVNVDSTNVSTDQANVRDCRDYRDQDEKQNRSKKDSAEEYNDREEGEKEDSRIRKKIRGEIQFFINRQQEIEEDINSQTEFETFNGRNNTEVQCTKQKVVERSKCEKKVTEKNLSATISCESCQSSTFTIDRNSLSEEIAQGICKNSCPTREVCVSNIVESDVENQMLSNQNSSCESSNRQKSLRFAIRMRRKYLESNGSESDLNESEPPSKKFKMDDNWSKQFETTFVFGPSNAPKSTDCSSQHQRDAIISDSCSVNVTPSISPKD